MLVSDLEIREIPINCFDSLKLMITEHEVIHNN